VTRRGGGLGGETVEGVQAVRELLRAERRRVHELWLARDDLDELDELAARSGVPVRRVPPARLARAAATAAPQGVLARAEPIPAASYERLLEDAACFLAAFDGVTDPQNLGAALRAAATAGATGAVLARARGARLGPAAVKAAAGAVEYLPIAVVSGIPAALSRARRRGVWAIGLAEDGTADVFDLPCADERLVLVAGAEGRGLGRLTRQRCDLLARIPVAGPLPSLNVATAVAVAAHAVAHRRRVPVPSRDAPE
jgi:23S rRNA (guanosine2251-2'-O)-methyltransferase